MLNKVGLNEKLVSTHTLGLAGEEVGLRVGFNAKFGGVGTEFTLINVGKGEANILEARSAAGAGMQTVQGCYSYGIKREDILFNQGCGNSVGEQWGLDVDLVKGSVPGIEWINQRDWVPLYSDSRQVKGSNAEGTSPEVRNVALLDYGKMDAAMSLAPNGAILMTHSYSYRSLYDQYWLYQYYGHALYLSRLVARQGEARMILKRKGGGSIYAPFIAYGFKVTGLPLCSGSENVYCVPSDIAYIMLVYTIFGKSVGVVMETPGLVQLRLNDKAYINDGNAWGSGSIDIQNNSKWDTDARFPKGSVRNYSVNYRIGTIEQLKEIGYAV